MKKHKIAAALVCVVFFACARGAIAQTMEEKIARFPDEWFLPDSYFPDGYQRGDTIPFFSPNDPYSDYDNRGTESINSGVGVPEPGTLVLLMSGGLGLLLMVWRRKAAAMCGRRQQCRIYQRTTYRAVSPGAVESSLLFCRG